MCNGWNVHAKQIEEELKMPAHRSFCIYLDQEKQILLQKLNFGTGDSDSHLNSIQQKPSPQQKLKK